MKKSMKKLRVADETFKVLEERAKVKGLSVDEYVCSLLQPLIQPNK